jgi:hypothetical protein
MLAPFAAIAAYEVYKENRPKRRRPPETDPDEI